MRIFKKPSGWRLYRSHIRNDALSLGAKASGAELLGLNRPRLGDPLDSGSEVLDVLAGARLFAGL